MDEPRYLVFETALGLSAIVWGKQGILSIRHPIVAGAKRQAHADLRTHLFEDYPNACEAKPTRAINQAIRAILAYSKGQPSDFSTLQLDMSGLPPFHQRVYQAVRTIPRGAIVSYGEVAATIDAPAAARAVGQAMSRNPFSLIVPCHRVTAAGGKLGGFSSDDGVKTKLRLLAHEGIAFPIRRKSRDTSIKRSRTMQLGFDPEHAIAHLRQVDAKLAAVIDLIGPFNLQLNATRSIFAALAESIVHQQLTGKAAATIFGRVCALFPESPTGIDPALLLQTPIEKLRSAGLSQAKSLALIDLAEKTQAGVLPELKAIHKMDDDAVIEALTQVRGIGRWTVEMMLIFRLGRPDVLAIDDYGIRKGYALAFRKRELPTPKELRKLTARSGHLFAQLPVGICGAWPT